MGNVPTINAIPTYYKGTEFRSRTEARWAVFLDELGIEWQFEAEGYDLLHGYYLPDFWLPQIDAFLEVKPGSEFDDSRICDLVAMTGKNLYLTFGAPGSSSPVYLDDHMPAVGLIAYQHYGFDPEYHDLPPIECDHANTKRVKVSHSHGFHVCDQCSACGEKVNPPDSRWLKHHHGDSNLEEWNSYLPKQWRERVQNVKRFEAYGRCGGYFDAPYYFCKCYGCGKWGCEFDGRSGRIDCGCNKGPKEYTAEYTRSAMQIAANYRFWNPGGAS